jgi:O-methyltransferase
LFVDFEHRFNRESGGKLNKKIPYLFSPGPSFSIQINGDLLSRVNLLLFIREWARVHSIGPYCIFEFGVLNGESIVEIIRLLRGDLSVVYGFDTFGGIPELESGDLEHTQVMPSFTEGNFQSNQYETVRQHILGASDINSKQLHLLQGDFRKTLKKFELSVQSDFPLVFHVDCDLYTSSKVALEFVENYAQDGSWLLLDDYWCYRGNPRMGQRRAFEEIINSSVRVIATPYSNYRGLGRAFILNLK